MRRAGTLAVPRVAAFAGFGWAFGSISMTLNTLYVEICTEYLPPCFVTNAYAGGKGRTT